MRISPELRVLAGKRWRRARVVNGMMAENSATLLDE
jgi:hypothetical protein